MTKMTLAVFLVAAATSRADGPRDNQIDNVRAVPPAGIVLSEPDRAELQGNLQALDARLELLRNALSQKARTLVQSKKNAALFELLPDVEIYAKAVRYALDYNEFFDKREVTVARQLLRQGIERAKQLEEGRPSWTTATGLVVRGYRSRIDGSVQPYGLVVPDSYQSGSSVRHRLDTWFHGRNENLSELNFIQDRQTNVGEFAPPDTFMLHLYGRYCNASKLAGEVDLFEALEDVKRHYRIDANRIAIRGFSMGGAACWQFAVHYAGLWAAAAPGAGFAETQEFLRIFQDEKVQPTWYEKKLWHLYDCTDYAGNLYNCPTIAYSGEIDKQKQAADIMAKAMAEEGLTLAHIIGPKTPHRYHPDAKIEIEARLASIMEKGRDPLRETVHFTTWTLRYNRMLWVQIDGLEQHWERARLDASLGKVPPFNLHVETANVSGFTLQMPAGQCPFDNTKHPAVTVDGDTVAVGTIPAVLSDRSWNARFHKVDGKWRVAETIEDGTLRKRHGLQGPIDDAFLDTFLMVRPSLKQRDETGKWTTAEMRHAVTHWRKQFRGDAPIKDDDKVTPEDIANRNLILWGDPSSNKILAQLADRLPIKWTAQEVKVGTKTYDANYHVPIMIYPNPLNPKRYVVLNSGFTYREYDYLNNARQVPKLPDWAVVDIRVPPSARAPGKIVDAGFFNESWELGK